MLATCTCTGTGTCACTCACTCAQQLPIAPVRLPTDGPALPGCHVHVGVRDTRRILSKAHPRPCRLGHVEHRLGGRPGGASICKAARRVSRTVRCVLNEKREVRAPTRARVRASGLYVRECVHARAWDHRMSSSSSPSCSACEAGGCGQTGAAPAHAVRNHVRGRPHGKPNRRDSEECNGQ